MEKDAEGFYTPASDSKPETQSEQEDSAYPDFFGGLDGQPQIPTRKVADQTQICDSETNLVESAFDVTVRRVKLLRLRDVPYGERMDQSLWLSFRLLLETNSWIRNHRYTVSRRLRNSDCTPLLSALLVQRLMVGRDLYPRLQK